VGALRSLAIALALLAATPAHADQVERWRPYIAQASAKFGIPAQWIEHVMRAESGGKTMLDGRPITSRAGAMGLMQLMPGTWAQIRAELGLGGNPHDPRDNILAGTAYLRLMYDRFGYPGLFAAYNAGPARYVAYVATGRTLPGETRAYLVSVGGVPASRPSPSQTAPTTPLFFALRSASFGKPSDRAGAARLFVRLNVASVTPAEAHP